MGGKFVPMSRKEIKAAAQTFAQLHAKKDGGSMMALALDGEERIYAHSAPLAAVPAPGDHYAVYLMEYASKLPWRGITPALTTSTGVPKPHEDCAEAHLWCEIMSRGKNPRYYNLVAFNQVGNIAAPCQNCEQWVENAFGFVYKESTKYKGMVLAGGQLLNASGKVVNSEGKAIKATYKSGVQHPNY